MHRAGMASSVEEVSYEFGSLLAVAFLGSLLSAIYTASVMLPAGAPEAMRDSMGGALALAAQAGADDQAIIDAASQAFDRGYLTVMYVVAAVLTVGAVITAVLLRNYGPGSQSSIYSSH